MTPVPRGLDRIPWQRLIARREAWIWFFVLVLSPAALVSGILLQQKVAARLEVRIPVTRSQAIVAARRYADSYGVRTHGWRTIMWVEASPALSTYLRRQKGSRAAALRAMVPPATLHVRFTSPDDSQSMEVLLDPEGSPTGFRRRQPQAMDNAPKNDRESAKNLVEETMHECMEARMPHLPMPAEPEVRQQVNGQEVFTYETRVADFPELTFTYAASVRGLTLLDSALTPKLDPKYEQSLDPLPWLKPALKGIGSIIGVVLFVFVFVRYVQRALQGEVSTGRMLIVSAIVGSTYLLFMLCGDQVAVQTSDAARSVPYWVVVLFGGVVMLLLGAAAGITYAGTEGDLRERYASKLTSLDALLLGRFASRNVGGSVVVGAALAFWLLLLHSAVELTAGSGDLGAEQLTLIQMIPFSRAPWAMILLSAPTSAVLYGTVGLLLPRVFSLRLVRRPRWSFGLFLVLAFIATCAVSDRASNVTSLLLIAALRLGLTTVAFYTLDFLTCVVMACGFSFTVSATTLSTIAPGILPEVGTAALAAITLLAVGLVSLVRGRMLRDEQVRPQYASNVAERLQLEEELLATREAHARLLPQAPPQVAGLSLAATCQASSRISGDFYDFFALAPHRVGLLLAEGGAGGLATALSIALAKGYMTQKARSGANPASLLQSLRGTLGELMEGQSDLGGVLYAVVDTAEQVLHYACLGPSPRLLIVPDRGDALERTTKLSGGRLLREGSVRLEPGTRVILYTKGLETHVSGALEHWLRLRLRRHDEGDATAIQQTLMHDLLTGSAGRATEPLGDITFILLATAETRQQSKEHVA